MSNPFILSLYRKEEPTLIQKGLEADLIKGGKRAEVGEIRYYNGNKYIRHADGWVYQGKDGSYKIKKDSDNQHHAADYHHIDHFQKTDREHQEKEKHEQTNFSKTNKPTPKVRRTLAANHATIEEAKKYKSLSKHVLEISKPAVQEVLKDMREKMKALGKEFKNDERQLMKIGTTYEIISAVTKYCKEDDKIVDYDITNQDGRMIVDFLIDRNGEDHHLSTEIIYAGGYNIQQLHTRYLVKTDLTPNKEDIFANAESGEMKALKDYYEVVDRINTSRKSVTRHYSKIDKATKFIEDLKDFPEENDEFLDKLDLNDEKLVKDLSSTLGTIPKDQIKGLKKPTSYIDLLKEKKEGTISEAGDKFLTQKSGLGKEPSFKNKILSSLKGTIRNSERDIKDEENKQYRVKLTSPLIGELRTPLSIDNFNWDKNTRTLKSNYKLQLKRLRVGHDDKPIDLRSKTIRLLNPRTNKTETFEYKKNEEKEASSTYTFESKEGLKVEIQHISNPKPKKY